MGKPMLRMKSIPFLLAVLLILSLIGCTGAPSPSPSPTQPPTQSGLPQIQLDDKKVTVLSQSSAENMKGVGDLVAAAYGLEVEFLSVSWSDLGTKISQLVLAGDAPDIYYARTRDFPLIAQKELVEPLDDLIDFSSPIFQDCAVSLAEGTYKGKHYTATSKGWIGHILWYNSKLFSENGLKTPRELFETNEWTWDTFLESAVALTDAQTGSYGFGGLRALDWWLATGKDIVRFESDGTPVEQFRDDDIMKAMEFWRELSVGKYKVISPELTPVEQFKQGKIAMMLDGIWLAQTQLIDMVKSGDADFLPIPRYPGSEEYNAWGVYTALAIGKGAGNPQGARAYIYASLYAANATKEQRESDPLLKETADISHKNYEDAGFDESDFTMLDFIGTRVVPSYSPSERIAGLTDYMEWVVCSAMRNLGTSYVTNLEVQEEWLLDFIAVYNEEVRGIKPTPTPVP